MGQGARKVRPDRRQLPYRGHQGAGALELGGRDGRGGVAAAAPRTGPDTGGRGRGPPRAPRPAAGPGEVQGRAEGAGGHRDRTGGPRVPEARPARRLGLPPPGRPGGEEPRGTGGVVRGHDRGIRRPHPRRPPLRDRGRRRPRARTDHRRQRHRARLQRPGVRQPRSSARGHGKGPQGRAAAGPYGERQALLGRLRGADPHRHPARAGRRVRRAARAAAGPRGHAQGLLQRDPPAPPRLPRHEDRRQGLAAHREGLPEVAGHDPRDGLARRDPRHARLAERDDRPGRRPAGEQRRTHPSVRLPADEQPAPVRASRQRLPQPVRRQAAGLGREGEHPRPFPVLGQPGRRGLAQPRRRRRGHRARRGGRFPGGPGPQPGGRHPVLRPAGRGGAAPSTATPRSTGTCPIWPASGTGTSTGWTATAPAPSARATTRWATR